MKLSHPYNWKLLKVSKIPLSKSDFQAHSPTFWSLHSSHGVNHGGKGGQTHGSSSSHPDSLPRKLAHPGKRETNLPPAYPVPPRPLSGARLDCQPEKVRPRISAGLQLSPSVVASEENVLIGQPPHPLQHAWQIFSAHLVDFTAKGLWSIPESKLHINYLELKVGLLALKHFEHLCGSQTVLIATDNTIVVAYINKKGGMKSGSLCVLASGKRRK